MTPIRILVFLVFVLLLPTQHPLKAQTSSEVSLAYISPAPGANYVMPGTTIAFRQEEPFKASSVIRGLVEVTAASGRQCEGELFLTKDRRTLIFKPFFTFAEGEKVRVQLNPGLELQSGRKIKPVNYSFTITEQIIPIDEKFIEQYILEAGQYGRKPSSSIPGNRYGSNDTTLPPGLAVPEILVHNQPPEGYYFYCPDDPWNLYPETEPFIGITDAYGTLVYYKKLISAGYDLKIQHNGMLSYYTYHPAWGHVVMDSAYQPVDTFKMGNGYIYTDFHDFQLYEDGHGFVMTFDAQLIDMSQIVPGGDPEATVMGFVMQELDEDKNVVFEWRSWDHFEITDTGPEIDLTADNIDYVHGNTIEVESDTSILLSSRNMHEVTKIHRNTGEIIWRLGGSQNQFTFLGDDTLKFNRQHDSRRQSNGLITVFDNGTTRMEQQYSSVPEFNVNPEDSSATLVNRYWHDPNLLGEVMGNAYYTPDSTIVIGWGSCEPGITEIDPEGNVLLEMQFDAFSYRAYRFPWRTTYFTFGADSLVLEYFESSDETTGVLTVKNNQDHPITLTGYTVQGEDFELVDTLPQLLPANDSLDLTIQFFPGNGNYTKDLLTLHSDINSDTLVQRISQQVELIAIQLSGQSTETHRSLDVSVFPNPVDDVLKIDLQETKKKVTAGIYGITGVKIREWKLNKGQNHIRLDFLPAGVYTLRLIDLEGSAAVFKVIRK